MFKKYDELYTIKNGNVLCSTLDWYGDMKNRTEVLGTIYYSKPQILKLINIEAERMKKINDLPQLKELAFLLLPFNVSVRTAESESVDEILSHITNHMDDLVQHKHYRSGVNYIANFRISFDAPNIANESVNMKKLDEATRVPRRKNGTSVLAYDHETRVWCDVFESSIWATNGEPRYSKENAEMAVYRLNSAGIVPNSLKNMFDTCDLEV